MHTVRNKGKTVKLTAREQRLIAHAARIKGVRAATFHRLYTVAAAARIVRRHRQLQQQTAASSRERTDG